MGPAIQEGPPDKSGIAKKPLGLLFYQRLKRDESDNNVLLVDSLLNVQLTNKNLLTISLNLAAFLKSIKIKKGDVILVSSENNWKYVATLLAGFYIGAKINLLNPDYTIGELKLLLAICQPSIIFCDEKSLSNFLKLQDEAYCSSKIFGYHFDLFDNLLKAEQNQDILPIDGQDMEDTALIVTSSGTTGFPKLVQISHAMLRTMLIICQNENEVGINENERLLHFLPFFHIFGCVLIFGSIFLNAKSVILKKFEPERFLQLIQEHKITKVCVVPPVVVFLVKHPMVDNFDCSSLNDIICGAACIKKDLEEQVQVKFNLKCVRQVYGCSEIGGAACLTPKNHSKSGSIGKPITTIKIKVCDSITNVMLGPNQTGELLIQNNEPVPGYLGSPKEAKNAFDCENFFRTGDLGYYDEDGFFFIVDRLKEIIKYKGFQVSPAELDDLLIQHPEIKDAGVIGIPDARCGEVPLAFVVRQPNSNISEEVILKFVEDNISAQKRLYGGVKFVDEIPKSASGKILRRKLKTLFDEQSK